jgi:hypothetical protein
LVDSALDPAERKQRKFSVTNTLVPKSNFDSPCRKQRHWWSGGRPGL